MTAVTKIAASPRITDQALINLINKSPELTSAFGKQASEDWVIEDEAVNDCEVISSEKLALVALEHAHQKHRLRAIIFKLK